MTDNSYTDQIATALAAAQGAMRNPSRNREVTVTMTGGRGTYKFAYATLDEIMDVIRKPLADNGLALIHSLRRDNGDLDCVTTILHASGQSLECAIPVIVAEGASAQGFGSALTYARRYGVCTLLALAADEDDDANGAAGNYAQATQRKPRQEFPDKGKRAGGEPVTDAPHHGAAASSPPAFDWKGATPEARTKYLLSRVPNLTTLEGCAESTKKLKESDVGAEGYRAIMRAITDREKAIQGAQQHVADDAAPALRQLRELFLDVATTAQDLDIAAQTWEETTEAGPIRTRGEELISARREAIA